MLRCAGFLQLILVFARIAFSFLDFVPSTICLYHSSPIEKCTRGNSTDDRRTYMYITQDESELLNTIGTLLEGVNSICLIAAIFRWKIFNVKKFVSGVIRVGHTWVWLLFCITNTLSILYVDIIYGTDKAGNLSVNAIGLISEMILQTIFASAINFISHETYLNWVYGRFWRNPNRRFIFERLFHAVLVAYFIRNFGFFLYDTALVSLSISLVKGTKVEGTRDWDSLLMLLTAAFRGSLTKFFFVKLFQGQQFPVVCENEEVTEPLLGPDRRRAHLGGYRWLDAARADEHAAVA